METLKFAVNEEIPVVADVDVLVVGGGPGGLGAAVMAARAGAEVALAEKANMPGGMAYIGEITPFMMNHLQTENPEQPYVSFDKPVYTEWVKKMQKYMASETLTPEIKADGEAGRWDTRMVSKTFAGLAAEDMLLEAGVRLFYHFQLVRTVTENGVIRCAVFATKSGFLAIRAKNFVDATGDADLTVLAGGKTDFGGPEGFCQPMTLCFKMEPVDWSRMPHNLSGELYNKAKAEGKIDCPRENLLIFHDLKKDSIHFNTTRIVRKSPVDALELSEAEIEARRQMRQIADWLIREVPGFEQARIQSVAAQIGVRESRRIRGMVRLTRDAFTKRQKFPDAVARCNYTIDIHSPTGTGTEIEHMPNTEYYEIPYGCLVPDGLRNLTVGGRPISVDHALHSSCRVMPPAVSIGQAAGLAAALSAKKGIPVCDLDGREVRAELKKMGAFL